MEYQIPAERRDIKVYSVTEDELKMLAWPFSYFLRRGIVKRIFDSSGRENEAKEVVGE